MITPLPGELIVEIELRSKDEQLDSGILLKETKYQGPPIHGRVYAIGEGIDFCEIGQRILFKSDKPHGFEYEDKKLMRLTRKEVQGVYHEDPS